MNIKSLLLLVLAFTLTTCEKDHMLDCFKGAGEIATEERTATPFENINLTNDVDLIIDPDTTFYISVTAGENIIDGIITELSGNTLYIRNENRCNWVRSFKNKYTVQVGMEKPREIYYDGSGNISCLDTIRSSEFYFECYNGSGSMEFLFNCGKVHLNNHIGRTDIHAKGITGESYIYINDVGTLDAGGLQSSYSYIRNSSTGDVHVNVMNEMGYEILYNGNIYYSGNPAIVSELHSGSGKLIPE